VWTIDVAHLLRHFGLHVTFWWVQHVQAFSSISIMTPFSGLGRMACPTAAAAAALLIRNQLPKPLRRLLACGLSVLEES
jgi:hypothetical protein